MILRTINEAFSFLGKPPEKAPLPSFDDPYMQRATWPCGCVVDFVHEHGGAFEWDPCAHHREASVEFWGAIRLDEPRLFRSP